MKVKQQRKKTIKTKSLKSINDKAIFQELQHPPDVYMYDLKINVHR
jgi:hypothetical protein